jgi:hypothetical protein
MNQAKPRTGTDGFLHHTRLGLVGWISYWCLGDSALAVDILVALINTIGLTELVSDALASRKQKEAETNTKIVDLFKDALDKIKNCHTEPQRVEFHIELACVMPPREAQGSKNGWIKPICDRLVLKRGKRSEKNGDRPYASEKTVENRAIFNKDRELLAQPVKVGDMVLSKGQLCELTTIGEGLYARSSSRFTVWVPGGMYFPWITTMSSGQDVSEYELGASGLPRASGSPQQPSKN